MLVVLIVLTLCFIWGNSLQSREVSSGASNRLLDLVNRFLSILGFELKNDFLLRKLAHFCEFALLAVEIFLLLLIRKGRGAGRAALICLAVAFVDEGIQHFSGRACRLSDVMIDFSGAVSGVIHGQVFAFAYKKRFYSER